MFMSKLMSWLITVAIMLASIGVLGKATLYLAIKAAESCQYEQFSLAKWNRALVGPDTVGAHSKNRNKDAKGHH